MGEARQRGTQQERRDKALKAERAKFPLSIACNQCKTALSDITPLDPRGFAGLRRVGVAHCSACDRDTWAVDGPPEAVERFRQFLEREGRGGAPAEAHPTPAPDPT